MQRFGFGVLGFLDGFFRDLVQSFAKDFGYVRIVILKKLQVLTSLYLSLASFVKSISLHGCAKDCRSASGEIAKCHANGET